MVNTTFFKIGRITLFGAWMLSSAGVFILKSIQEGLIFMGAGLICIMILLYIEHNLSLNKRRGRCV